MAIGFDALHIAARATSLLPTECAGEHTTSWTIKEMVGDFDIIVACSGTIIRVHLRFVHPYLPGGNLDIPCDRTAGRRTVKDDSTLVNRPRASSSAGSKRGKRRWTELRYTVQGCCAKR